MNACIAGCCRRSHGGRGAGHSWRWPCRSAGNRSACQADSRLDTRKRFKDIEGSVAIILLPGYHMAALTPGGTTPIRILRRQSKGCGSMAGKWGDWRRCGGAAEYHLPVVMVAGDDKTCAEARSWIPGVVTCQTKKGTGPQSADLVPLEEARASSAEDRRSPCQAKQIRQSRSPIRRPSAGIAAERLLANPQPFVQTR